MVKGNILEEVENALVDNSKMTVGEILYSVLHPSNFNGRHYFYASDKEIYTALKKFNAFKEEEDTPYNEEEFTQLIARLCPQT